jgi:hypothetical protein
MVAFLFSSGNPSYQPFKPSFRRLAYFTLYLTAWVMTAFWLLLHPPKELEDVEGTVFCFAAVAAIVGSVALVASLAAILSTACSGCIRMHISLKPPTLDLWIFTTIVVISVLLNVPLTLASLWALTLIPLLAFHAAYLAVLIGEHIELQEEENKRENRKKRKEREKCKKREDSHASSDTLSYHPFKPSLHRLAYFTLYLTAWVSPAFWMILTSSDQDQDKAAPGSEDVVLTLTWIVAILGAVAVVTSVLAVILVAYDRRISQQMFLKPQTCGVWKSLRANPVTERLDLWIFTTTAMLSILMTLRLVIVSLWFMPLGLMHGVHGACLGLLIDERREWKEKNKRQKRNKRDENECEEEDEWESIDEE